MITINELFSGIGAQVAALKRLGIEYETVGISEIDRFAIQSYEAINGKTRNYGDISKAEALDYADLWTYSFPCTDISLAGKQEGLTDKTGKQTRSGLLFEVERLLRKSVEDGNQPKYLLLENVKNLVGKKFKPEFDKWLQTLDALGYNNYWKVLNAKDYGIPQNRERVFVVSMRKDVDIKGYEFPLPIKLEKRLKDMLEDVVDEKYYLSDEKVGNLVKSLEKKIETQDISNTIRCGGGGSLDGKHTWDLVIGSTQKNAYRGSTESVCSCLTEVMGMGGGQIPMVTRMIEPLIAASRGRNPDNPSDRTAGVPTEQRMEINSSGVSNTLPPVQKDNLVVEPISAHIDDTAPASTATDYKTQKCHSGIILLGNIVETDSFGGNPERGRVYDDKGISPCLSTMQGGGLEPKVLKNYRIRKLTPKECWRLMGFTDLEFDLAKMSGVSNTQLYKQAGNSIVVDVLAAIFRELFIGDDE